MKLIYSIILLVLSLSTLSQNLRTIEKYYDPYSMTQIKEQYTVETQRMQKHGLYQSWDKFGTIYEEINYKNGKKDGLAKQYFTHNYVKTILWENDSFIGKVEEEATFKNDQLDGTRKRYTIEDGQYFLTLEQVYNDGKMLSETKYYGPDKPKHKLKNNGLCERWYENGQKEAEFYRKDGIENGKGTSWYENGQVHMFGTYSNGVNVGEWTVYYPDGSLKKKETFWKETGLSIKKKEYTKDGYLIAEIIQTGESNVLFTLYDTISNTPISKESLIYKISPDEILVLLDGECTYYSNGKEISKGMYKNDKRVGSWKIYYDKDFKETYDLDSAEFYREITFNDNGEPIGKVVDYYISGQKQWEGELLSINPDVYDGECSYYYPNGQLQSQQFHNKGTKTGTWKSYYNNGQLVEQVTFVNDVPDGQYYQYWENGNVKQEGVYRSGMFIGEWKFYNENKSLNTIKSYDDNGNLITSLTPKEIYNDFVKNKRYSLENMGRDIEEKYTIGKTSFQKNTIYNAFVDAHNYLLSQIDQTDNYEVKLNNYERLFNLSKKVSELSDEEIKELSKLLKKADSPDTILNIFSIE